MDKEYKALINRTFFYRQEGNLAMVAKCEAEIEAILKAKEDMRNAICDAQRDGALTTLF